MLARIRPIILTIILFLVLLSLCIPASAEEEPLTPWDGTVAGDFGGGSGDIADPYLIQSASEFAFFAEQVRQGNSFEGRFVSLETDILWNDFSAIEIDQAVLSPIVGDSTHPFSGYFEGNGHSITGVYSAEGSNIGTFALLQNATVANLSVSGIYNGEDCLGGIAAKSIRSVLHHCSFEGSIVGNNDLGGIAGLFENSTLHHVSSQAVLSGNERVGGILGQLTVSPSPEDAAPVLSTLQQVCSFGTITANGLCGSLIGVLNDDAETPRFEILDCYYLEDGNPSVGQSPFDVASTSCQVEEMKEAGTYASFDFTLDWDISESNSLPVPRFVHEHIYDNECDDTCNRCSEKRVAPHKFNPNVYEGNGAFHWNVCILCLKKINVEVHTFEHSCDSTCSVCGLTRPTSHTFPDEWEQDDTGHWKICSVCGETGLYHVHTYTSSCSTTCTICGHERTIEHTFGSYQFDENFHWKQCLICGAIEEKGFHVPGPAATSTSPQVCIICNKILKPAITHKHSFTISRYDEENHWKECSCGEKADIAPHTYGEGIVILKSTTEREGLILYACTGCSAIKREITPKLDPSEAEPPDPTAESSQETTEPSSEPKKKKGCRSSLTLTGPLTLLCLSPVPLLLKPRRKKRK